ncbi:hypothetical protein D9M68_817830 [compost metagenome]
MITRVLPSRTCTSANFWTMDGYELLMDCSLLTTRQKVNSTSWAVKGWPLENLTPSRSVNSQVVSSTGFQAVARRGIRFILASWPTSVSNMCEVIASFGVAWW